MLMWAIPALLTLDAPAIPGSVLSMQATDRALYPVITNAAVGRHTIRVFANDTTGADNARAVQTFEMTVLNVNDPRSSPAFRPDLRTSATMRMRVQSIAMSWLRMTSTDKLIRQKRSALR